MMARVLHREVGNREVGKGQFEFQLVALREKVFRALKRIYYHGKNTPRPKL